jgi:multidrug efflux pump subunit AcrA (membrane-fusion protein)
MRRHGQWIEPAKLWHVKLAAQQRLAFAQQNFQQALTELNSARDAARRAKAGPVPEPEPMTPFWELW